MELIDFNARIVFVVILGFAVGLSFAAVLISIEDKKKLLSNLIMFAAAVIITIIYLIQLFAE